MDYILEEMNEANADGVDFVPLTLPESKTSVIASYTKEEWINRGDFYPKSDRKYWRMIDGMNIYCK